MDGSNQTVQSTRKRHTPVSDIANPTPLNSIDGFDVEDEIGKGGMATVWKAYQKSLDRIVAIKVLRPDFAADPEEVRFFMNEARAAAKLAHPNIVQVYDTGIANGIPYIVMEYVNGKTIGRLLRDEGLMPQKKALHVGCCVAEALEYAWRRAGLVHRDIKPDNIMIDGDGMVKVADLGLARQARGHGSENRPTLIEGTPNYMAPEQVQGLPADQRTDIYALGATLYHLLTGVLPFKEGGTDAAMQGQLTGKLANPRDLNPRLSIGVVRLLSRMMMKNPSERPADWSAALADLKRVASGRPLMPMANPGGSTVAAPVQKTSPKTVARTDVTPAGNVPVLWRKLRLVTLTLIWVGFAGLLLLPFAERLRTLPDKPFDVLELPEIDEPVMTVRPVQEQLEPQTVIDDPVSEAAVAVPLSRQIALEVVPMLFGGRHAEAMHAIERARDQIPDNDPVMSELLVMAEMIEAAATINRRIWDSFHRQVGHRVVMRRNGRDVPMVVGAVADTATDQVVELRDPEQPGRTEVIRVAQLDPLERLRWVGPANSPDKALIHVLLLLEAGNVTDALAMARRCGPMAGALVRYIDGR